LRSWAKEFLAAYKLPSCLLVLEALPRNAMGKVTKPAIATMFRGTGGSD
jgi:malonyl-CoA/methylmalonyl-CoA synthetase